MKKAVTSNFNYENIKKDPFGWVDPSNYLPYPYDIVKGDTGEKIISVWWDGLHWQGYKLAESDKIIGWKRMERR